MRLGVGAAAGGQKELGPPWTEEGLGGTPTSAVSSRISGTVWLWGL